MEPPTRTWSEWLSEKTSSAKNAVTSVLPGAKPLVEPVPVVAPEASGFTSGGGRRRKTRRHKKSRKSKKTRKH